MSLKALLKPSLPKVLRVGVVCLVALPLLVGAYWIVGRVKRVTPVVGLSAWFDPSGSLQIKGQIQASGKPMDGQARVTVEQLPVGQRQTIIVGVTNGNFSLSGEQAFLAFHTNDLMRVKVSVWPSERGRPANEQLVLNGEAPLIPRKLTYCLLGVAAFFFLGTFLWAFTGKYMPGKNRVAIILSYCIILICLGVPLLSPIIIPRVFPDLLKDMVTTPVGVLVAVDPRFQTKTDSDVLKHPQWMLNIGGYATTNLHQLRTDGPGNLATEGALPPGAVVVLGGLLVPLYVIILSIIGGAINMTMKLPLSQRDQESEIQLNLRGSWRALTDLVVQVKTKLAKPAAAESPASGGELTAPANSPDSTPRRAQPAQSAAAGMAATGAEGEIADSSPQAPTHGHRSGDPEPNEKLVQWRQELLQQYMFLISAPFLAIVTYYLLIWLDLVKVPVLVVVSFSIGLITQSILDTIINSVKKALTSADSIPAKPAADSRNGATAGSSGKPGPDLAANLFPARQ
ncbi:MAG: hypothetical protein U1G07_20750 [Verrucomicrobiota bacterium]